MASAVYCLMLVTAASADDVKAACAQTAVDNNLIFNSITTAQSSDEFIVPSEMVKELAAARVVVVGETHDQWTHHLTQLEIICQFAATMGDGGADAKAPSLAIGLEQFQRRAQPHLDDYIAGGLSLQQLLQETDYFNLWGFDFRLYAPIIQWARENQVKLLALNADTDIVELVRSTGFEELTEAQRATLPFKIEPRSDEYTDRLKQIFDQHASSETDQSGLRRFVQVQQTWEATMSATALAWLNKNPQAQMVILAGAGHTVWPETIPDLLRSEGLDGVVSVAMNVDDYLDPETASDQRNQLSVDYRLQMSAQALTPAGRMGVALTSTENGVVVDDFAENSAARDAGIETGDRLIAIDGKTITSYAQVRQQLWQALAGDSVEVQTSRDGDSGRHTFRFQLR